MERLKIKTSVQFLFFTFDSLKSKSYIESSETEFDQ